MIDTHEDFYNIKHLYSSQNSNVYTAIDKLTNKFVALKTINENEAGRYSFERIQNEYDRLLKIKSEFVPEAISYSKVGDSYCLVLEYCEGMPLSDYIEKAQMSVKEFLNIALQIVQGIKDIHNAGVIHKDINPANIIYDNKKRKVTIIDFGLATEFTYEKNLNVKANVSEGTLYYISPEQTGRMNHAIDFRTDFYSLGVTFFEMLCRCHPFQSESQTQIIYMHLAKLPPLARDVNSEVPEMISQLIYKLMAKMPEDRYSKAEGILYDLNRCLELLDADGEINEFELGAGDYSDHFEMTQKLYGREKETAILRSSYQDILKGDSKLVTISGHSGIGKTSLVGELYKAIANTNGMFIAGKFDQYHRNTPNLAILQAIEHFCNVILSGDENSIEIWKTRITEAIKKDGKLLVDRIPKLALITGELQELPELSPLEERIRLKVVLVQLLGVIASPERPLVIFIDDIHLADLSFLEVVEEIMTNDQIKSLLIVACYRDNEVSSSHPFMLSINKMLRRQVGVQQIRLVGLTTDAAAQMIAEALHVNTGFVMELTKVIYGKTNGNPFYMKQFIKFCHRKRAIFFDVVTRQWMWNIEDIKTFPAEENVVEFLIRNMDYIPHETIELLSLGACIGQTFKVSTLSLISGKKIEQIMSELKDVVSSEVIYPIKNNDMVEGETQFNFSHDRFQQTFYSILRESEKANIHYKLAVHYEKLGYGNSEHSRKHFIMAENYSKAFNMLEGKEEKKRVARILLRAAHLAGIVSSYDTALHYSRQIISNFKNIGAEDHFARQVYIEYHATLFSISEYEEADEVYAMLESLVKEPIELTDSCCLQAISLSNRGRYQDAFMLGIGLLERFGVHFPIDNLLNTIIKEIDIFYGELGKEEFVKIEELPKAENLSEICIGKILNRICTAGFFYNPLYSFWAIITSAKRVLENGYTPEGLSLYGSLTLLLIPFRNDYKLSYDLAFSAMKLAEKNGYKVFRMYHLFALINCHWMEELKNSIAYARESCIGNISTGDFEFACFTYFTTLQITLETCENIEELMAESDAALAFAKKHGNLHAYGSFVSFRQLYSSLINKREIAGSFEDETFNEAKHIETISKNQMALCFFYTLKALSAAIFLDFNTTFELTEKAAKLMPAITGFYANALHNFLNSLAICKKLEHGVFTDEEKTMYVKKLIANQNWLSERATDAPANFQHMYDLIEAERYAIENRNTDSFTVFKKILSLYEKAIIGAKESSSNYHYALACELAGMNFVKMDSLRFATIYLKEAYSAYFSWGASAKVEQMMTRHKELRLLRFNSLKYREEYHLATKSVTSSNTLRYSGMFLTNSSVIDFNAIIKASQAISGETKLEAILEKLINVLLENSGAQDIYYIVKENEEYFIQAEGHSEENKVLISHNIKVEIEELPMKILNYVERTCESIILDDASASDIYGGEEYTSLNNCKSVMCLPVVYKGKLKGLLYLKNNLIEGVFNKQRTEALKIIAAQLAISLENAYLIDNLQHLVDERTCELREEIVVRKNAEKCLEQMANNDMLTNLPNRRMFQNCLDHAIEMAKINNSNLAVLFLDLDGFKAVNDKYGHDKGDIVLIATARRLVDSVRSCDTVSRMGGDEFVMILENVKSIEEIETICKRIIASVEIPIEFEELKVQAVVTSSIGISLLNTDGNTAEELISNADKAMYVAKNNGKNQYVFYSD